MAYSVAVTSGKGGVGKTSIAINLGMTLSREGQRVSYSIRILVWQTRISCWA